LIILEKTLGENHIEVGDCRANLGDACMKLYVEANRAEKLSEAKELYKKAHKISTEVLGPGHTKTQQYESLLFICDNYSSW